MTKVFGLHLLIMLVCLSWGVVGQANSAGAELPDPVAINAELMTRNDERRSSRIGDVVHEDRRVLSTVNLVPTRNVSDACDSGWCHSLNIDKPLVFAGYGPRIFCTTTQSGKRDTLFSDYPSYSCIQRSSTTGLPDGIFGLKELSNSISVRPSKLPSSVQIRVVETPLSEYPDWLIRTGRNYIDGLFRVRFLGLQEGKIVFEIEHEPELPGSAPSNVQRIQFDMSDKEIIRLPLIKEGTDYSEIDTGRMRLDGTYYSGIIMTVFHVDAESIEYEIRNDNKLIQLHQNGFWQIRANGEGVEVQTRYR